MDKNEFESRMASLIPDYDPDAMKHWHEYIAALDSDDICPMNQLYEEIYVEFSLVCKHNSPELAKELFSIANVSCLNPFEVRGAANHLHNGVPLNKVAEMAIIGECDSTLEEDAQFKDALTAYRQEKLAEQHTKPSIIAQLDELASKSHNPTKNHPQHKKTDPVL